ncbi:MAG: TRAP transporter small permease [Rhodospirillales bacterium]
MFAKTATAIEGVLRVVLVAILVTMVLSICLQVTGRYLFGFAPAWTEEVARFSIAWITMLGSALVLRRNGHIAVTIVTAWLPRRLAAAVALLRDGLIVMMAGALAIYGYSYAVLGGRRASPALEIPMYYPFLAIPLGAVLIVTLLLLKRAAAAGGDEPS